MKTLSAEEWLQCQFQIVMLRTALEVLEGENLIKPFTAEIVQGSIEVLENILGGNLEEQPKQPQQEES